MAGTSEGHFVYQGKLTGHGGWVTSIATPLDRTDSIISSSRDKTVMVWDVSTEGRDRARQMVNEDAFGLPLRRLVGHADFVQDVALSSDGQFALSGSLDTTLRLWDLSQGRTVHSFASHSKDVLSVAFSPDNRQIVSGGRDHVLKVWNALGECKYTINEGAHTDWVSCVRFSPNQQAAHIVSGGWDKKVKIWSLRDFKLYQDLIGHTGYVSTVTISPDGSLCASGGRDGIAFLWDLNRGEKLYALGDADEPIHSLTFSPNRYWLCAATDKKIKIWDLESKQQLATLVPSKDTPDGAPGPRAAPECVSLAWSADGSTLYSGYTDNAIRVWGVSSATA